MISKKSLKSSRVLNILDAVVGAFVGMIVALSWNSFMDSILSIIKQKIAFLGIIGYLLYAIIITVIAVLLVISYVNFIEKISNEENKDN